MKKAKSISTVCNVVDLEILLFFNPELASSPHYVRTRATNQETSHYKTFIPQNSKWSVSNAGLEGALYLNLYDGVSYLNDLFYPLPKTHCAKPVKLANGGKKNAYACGSKYQQHTVNTPRLRSRAKKTVCYKPPIPPQEAFFSCQYTILDCVFQSFAAASGLAGIVAFILTLGLVSISNKVLGIPVFKDEDEEEAEVDEVTAAFLACFAFFRDICTNKEIEFEADDEKDKNATNIELSDAKDNTDGYNLVSIMARIEAVEAVNGHILNQNKALVAEILAQKIAAGQLKANEQQETSFPSPFSGTIF
jgi:hypothetical protein